MDASALLAVINEERGAEAVLAATEAPDLPAACTVNLAEVVARLAAWGSTEPAIDSALASVAFEIADFDQALAFRSGLLRPLTRDAGLSLGDRACLALAMQLGVPTLTADRSCASLGLPVEVQVIR